MLLLPALLFALAQPDSCLGGAADLAALDACTEREVRPLEEQFARRTERLLSKYPDARWRNIVAARESWRYNDCMAEGEIRALRSNGAPTLEKRRGFVMCQKRVLQSLLQALDECDRTSSRCEHAMSMAAAGVEQQPVRGTIPQLTEAKKELMNQSSAASARARVSYCSGPALQAVADLERSIPLLERVHAEVWSSLPDTATVLNYDLMLRHARLAKLHRTLGDDARSARHADIARSLKIGDKSVPDPLALVLEEDTRYCAGLR